MTHESETAFVDKVEAELAYIYGAENVHRNVHLDNTGRYCDLWVETPARVQDLAIEAENDFESAFGGASQALLYAYQLDAHPMVIVPLGHVEYPEAFYLSAAGVDIFQFDVMDDTTE